MSKGKSILGDIVARTMRENGLSEDQVIAKIATQLYGDADEAQMAKNMDSIRAILNYNEVGKRKVGAAVKAAGGTEDEVLMAELIVSSEAFKNGKNDLDKLAQEQLGETVANFWNDFDEKSYAPFYTERYNEGAALLADYKAKKAAEKEKATKKAADTAVEAPVADEPATVSEDPFDN